VVGGLVSAGLLALLIGVGDRQVAIREIAGEPGSAVVGIGVASCNQEPRVEVNETQSQVRLSAFIHRPGLLEARGDCRDQASVTLESPLNRRQVVDTSSGDVLPLLPE
jgi:hypothetical protein